MNISKSSLLFLAAALISGLPAIAQTPADMSAPPKKRVASTSGISPHETFSVVLGNPRNGSRVTIVYGRPYSADPKTGEIREIWGKLVPYDKVWRTGSDEATLLITQKPIVIGDVTVPAGAFTLWTLPAADGSAKLIINKQIGQWGLGRGVYDQANDVGRADLKKGAADSRVDEFTMDIAKNKDGSGLLTLTWENIQYSVPITVAK